MPSIEPLPGGANFRRAKTIWEIALDIAGNPAEPYYGNRDVRITVGSGSGDAFRSWLSFSTGSPILAHAVARGEVDFAFVNPSEDIVFDEGINGWAEIALANGFQLVRLDDFAFEQLQAIGWRRVVLPKSYSQYLEADHDCIDYSGWPLYTRASLPDDDAYRVCASLNARCEYVPWEDPLRDATRLGADAEATPRDVPLHPGAARWYREHGIEVPH